VDGPGRRAFAIAAMMHDVAKRVAALDREDDLDLHTASPELRAEV